MSSVGLLTRPYHPLSTADSGDRLQRSRVCHQIAPNIRLINCLCFIDGQCQGDLRGQCDHTFFGIALETSYNRNNLIVFFIHGRFSHMSSSNGDEALPLSTAAQWLNLRAAVVTQGFSVLHLRGWETTTAWTTARTFAFHSSR